MILSNFLIFAAVPFVISAVFFGTKNGYYNSDDYEGDGCAHDVQRWQFDLTRVEVKITFSYQLVEFLIHVHLLSNCQTGL